MTTAVDRATPTRTTRRTDACLDWAAREVRFAQAALASALDLIDELTRTNDRLEAQVAVLRKGKP